MKCRTIMAVLVAKRKEVALKVQEVLTKYGCIISLRVGLHETANICDDRGLILLSLCGSKKEGTALKTDLQKIKYVKVKTIEL